MGAFALGCAYTAEPAGGGGVSAGKLSQPQKFAAFCGEFRNDQ